MGKIYFLFKSKVFILLINYKYLYILIFLLKHIKNNFI